METIREVLGRVAEQTRTAAYNRELLLEIEQLRDVMPFYSAKVAGEVEQESLQRTEAAVARIVALGQRVAKRL